MPDGLRVLLAGAIAAGRKTRTDFLRRLCLLFVLLGFLARSFEGILRADVPSPGTGTEIPGRRNSEQRRLSAAVFQSLRNPRPRHRARRELRGGCAAKGIETRAEFFGRETASRLAAEGLQADLLLGNNVLAHVPDINDFVAGLKIALKPSGVVTMEFPHLLQLDTTQPVRHDLSRTLFLPFAHGGERIFARHGLSIFDVEELTTHGGSLRIFARHAEDGSPCRSARGERFRSVERRAGLDRASTYQDFGRHVQESKRKLLTFLIRAKEEGRRVWGYGAPAKGNTLLNYCGIRATWSKRP